MLYTPIALQSLGKRKVPQEAAFKAIVHLLCDAAAGEFTFLECVPVQMRGYSPVRRTCANGPNAHSCHIHAVPYCHLCVAP